MMPPSQLVANNNRTRELIVAIEDASFHFAMYLFAADSGGTEREGRQPNKRRNRRRRGERESMDRRVTIARERSAGFEEDDDWTSADGGEDSWPPAAAADCNNNDVDTTAPPEEDEAAFAGGAASTHCCKRRPPSLFNCRNPRTTAHRMRAMAQVYELLLRNNRATKRDLFYEHKLLYGTQRNFDQALSALCKFLIASRTELHVMGCSRGFAIGDMRLYNGMDDEAMDFHASPVAIFESLTHFDFVESEAQFLLIVEKDAIFQRLIDEQFVNKFPRGILVTGRGYPDICTRQFLHWLTTQMPNLPMLALVDADPYGVDILLTYKYGSERSHVEAGGLQLPRVRWLGFLPSEALDLPIPQNQFLQLSLSDRRRIERLTQHRMLGEDDRATLSYELSIMLNNGWKLELEALCAISANYMSGVYLDHKLLPFRRRRRTDENGGAVMIQDRRDGRGEEEEQEEDFPSAD